MSRSTGPSRNRCSITPEDLERAQQLLRADLGHRRRRPPLLVHRAAFAARRRHVDHAAGRCGPPSPSARPSRKMSSSGCAQIPTIVPSAAVSVHRSPSSVACGRKSAARRRRTRHPCSTHAPRSPVDDLVEGYASAMIVLIRSLSESGTDTLGTSRRDELLQVLAELRAIQARASNPKVVVDARREIGVHLAVEVRLDLEEGLGASGSTLTHRRILAPWPSPTTPSRALSFPDADRLITVPIGVSMISAISLYEKPSTSASRTGSRKRSGSDSTASFTAWSGMRVEHRLSRPSPRRFARRAGRRGTTRRHRLGPPRSAARAASCDRC